MTSVRLIAATLVCGAIGLAGWLALGGSGAAGGGGADLSLAGIPQPRAPELDSLVVPAMESLDGGQQALDGQQARRESPAMFIARVRSQTAFAGLDGAQAARLARKVFPALIERQAGGMPRLPGGARLVRYVSPTAAQLELPGGKRGALESTSAIAKPGAGGHLAPVELGLERSGGGYRPKAPVVAVNIPQRLSEGVSAPASGVSLVPVDARGVPLHAEGSPQGASVLYTNSGLDTDTVAKPTSAGFELDAILRSQRSPRTLYYRVRLPRGARLAQRPDGGVEVVGAHGGIGRIPAPPAQDASGAAVPVTMSIVTGDTLVVRVDGATDETQWPIDVDPTYWKKDSLSPGWEECPLYGVCTRGMHNWEFITSNSQIYEMEVAAAYWWPIASYKGGEYAGIQYKTQGESKIFDFEAKVKTVFGYNVEANIDLIRPNGKGGYEPESEQKLSSSETSKEAYVCGGSTCEVTAGYPGNIARFMTNTTAEGKAKTFIADIEVGDVYLSQEKGPEVSFNTTSPTITVNGATRTNVLYGSGTWLSPYSGAVGFSATDPGIGVSGVRLTSSSSLWQEVNYHREGLCLGLRCAPAQSGSFTYSPSMENGEHSYSLSGEDGVKAPSGKAEATIKVDTSKPYNLGFTGMPEVGAEVSAAPHALTVHATDGKAPTPSSGIQSIAVSIDGTTPTAVTGASCPAGECTASGEYTLHAESLSEGVHRLTVNAVSNSGEPEAKEFLFDVRHASPVSVGPGSVDPTTGQFTLTASDVSLGGASGVSRSYQSRNLTAGAGGPLGPQWAMSVGGGEGLTVLPSGSVVLVSGSGGATTFTLNAKGEFEAPKGDENLKVEYKAAEHRYVLKDATAGSETVFEQPAGTQSTPPTFGTEFGAEAGVLNRPVSVALDASGDLWITDWVNARVAEYSKTGTLIATYGSEGAEGGQFHQPWGIAVNQSTGNVYVTDDGNSRIVELSSSGAFIRAIGWGVSNDKAELQTCTSSCLAGIAGTGAGQLDAPQGITIDSSGDLWVAEYNSNRVQEFSETGSYVTAFGSAGSGAGQFEGPMNIAFAGGDVYVTDQNNDRVDELSTSGSFVKTIGWGVSNGEEKLETCTSGCKGGIAGAGNGQFNGPRGLTVDPVSGNLYVSEINNNRVQEITTSGSFVSKFGSGGSGPGQFAQPMGVAASSTGAIYVTDFEHASVQEWMRPTWLPASAKGALPGQTTYTYTPIEGNEGTTSMQPYEVISPTPSGVECGTKAEELKEEKDKGCRALTFKYATETTAKGESQSEWGEYKGHLVQVAFHAWSPSTKAMEEKAVAQYSYDKQGRLRAEWDPRIESSTACGKTCSALKTIYGYDEGGHVTAVSPAGQEPWLVHYGSVGGDPSTGRLLSVARPPAESSTSLKEQKELPAPDNTSKPTLSSTTPEVGVTLTASSEGKWSNSPLAYGYQWEDCHMLSESELTTCTAIPGAVNQSYTPQASDAGYGLVVRVTAQNADGDGSASSREGTPVVMPAPSYASTFGASGSESEKLKEPAGVAVDSEGDIWVADLGKNRIVKFSSTGAFLASFAPDSMSEPEGVAISPLNHDVYVTNRGRDRIDELSTSGALVRVFGGEGTGVGELKSPDQLTVDANGDVWVDDTGNQRIEEFSSAGVYMNSFGSEGSGHGQFKNPTGIAVCGETIYVTDQGNQRVQMFSLEGKWIGRFGREGKGNGEFSNPSQIACEPVGYDVYVSDKSNNRIEEFNAAGVFLDAFFGTGETQLSTPIGVAVGAKGVVYPSDYGNGRVEKWTANYSTSNPTPSPPSVGKDSVWTVAYHVPLSGPEGSDLANLTKEEVEKWGQKDNGEYEDNDPVEGMAIFPPDEPQGWPAADYKRATVDYMNGKGLTVNTAAPTGGVATTEYNELNEGIRTLSADNRSAAMKEGCLSLAKKECKSTEVAEKLDTKTEYNAEGSQIVKVLGPEHKVKLSSGEETQARTVTRNHYNEGAQEAEEKSHEAYNLVTKSTSGALLSNGEEKDVRTTITSYNGQEDLGWKLRKPTSVTTDPTGLDLTRTTEYDKITGSVIETKAPGGTSVATPPPAFSLSFGSEGTGNGQFKRPVGVATDASGHVWVNDRENDRIEKFSATGAWEGSYGAKGSGTGQMEGSWDLAVNQSTGNVYVGDSWNDRVDEFNSSGSFVEAFGWGVSDGKEELEVCKASCRTGLAGSGKGQLNYPLGMAVDSQGDIWVVDLKNDRVEEFSQAGAYMTSFGSKGSGNGQLNEPNGIVIDEGEVYVVDQGNHRVEELSTTGGYLSQFGSEGTAPGQFREPTGIAVNPNNSDIYVADESYNRVEEFSPAGKFLVEFGSWGTGPGHFEHPAALAIDAGGDLYVGEDTGERVDKWTPPGAGAAHMTFSTQFGSAGSGSEQFNEPMMSAIDGQGDVWVTDFNHARVKKFTAQGKFLASYGSYGTGEGQFEAPTGIAINQGTGNVYVSDCEDNRVEELSSSGGYVRAFGGYGSEPGKMDCPMGVKIDASGDVWVADAHNNRIEEFSSTGTFKVAYGSKGTGNKEFEDPSDIAISGSDIYVADSGNRRVQELTTSGEYVTQFGNQGDGGGQFVYPEAMATDAAGHLFVVDFGNDRVEEFSSSGQFLTSFGSHGTAEGQLNGPRGIAINTAGEVYVTDTENNRIEIWASTNQAAHDTETIYYSAEANSTYPNCGKHPEWAELVCQTQPAAQPERGLPEPPISTVASYNIWDEAEKTEEKFGAGSKAVARTKTETYDPAGRAVTSEETSLPETSKPLPKVTDEYNAETGALEKQGTSEGTITSTDNTLGQQIEYKDASGNVVKYVYEEGSDGRLLEVSEGKGEEAKSSQTYSYNATTGLIEKLVDSAAGTFKAGYDAEGKMSSETYPNNMTATTAYDSVGQATGLVYEKNADCASKCPETWFSDSVVPSIHGETLQQTSTLSKESYAYDHVGRLLETQETPAGKGCVARLYSYDEEGNRTSETKREPGTEGKCSTEGGTVERHTYDEASRLTDEGVEYETFGNTTKMPSSDAGGHEIVSTYYVDNQVAGEKQNEQLLKYTYDPTGRTQETVAENEKAKTKIMTISHYADSGDALTWMSEGAEKWTRNIPGIDGALDAVQEAGKTPMLQLHDLQGNVVGSVEDSESATKLQETYNSIEFGVPNEGKTPPKYAWLGASGVSTEPSQGTGTSTQSGASYVPQIARALQTAPVVPPGAFPNGSPGTQTTAVVSPAALAYAQEQATQAWQRAEAERQKAREEEARKRLEECRAEGGCSEETLDPEGILTGKEASHWASELAKNALELESYLNAGYCGKGTGCEDWLSFLETDAEIEGAASEELYACAAQVKNGRWVTDKFGFKEYQNAVCYYHYTTKRLKSLLSSVTVFSTFGPVEACWSPELEAGIEWYCPGHGDRFF